MRSGDWGLEVCSSGLVVAVRTDIGVDAARAGRDVGDRRAVGKGLNIRAVAAAAVAEIGIEALGIDFERRRGLPLQRAVDLMPLARALLREVLEDAGNDIARRVERTGVDRKSVV